MQNSIALTRLGTCSPLEQMVQSFFGMSESQTRSCKSLQTPMRSMSPRSVSWSCQSWKAQFVSQGVAFFHARIHSIPSALTGIRKGQAVLAKWVDALHSLFCLLRCCVHVNFPHYSSLLESTSLPSSSLTAAKLDPGCLTQVLFHPSKEKETFLSASEDGLISAFSTTNGLDEDEGFVVSPESLYLPAQCPSGSALSTRLASDTASLSVHAFPQLTGASAVV